MNKPLSLFLSIFCIALLIISAWYALASPNTPADSPTLPSQPAQEKLASTETPGKPPTPAAAPPSSVESSVVRPQRPAPHALKIIAPPMETKLLADALEAFSGTDFTALRKAQDVLAHCTPADLPVVNSFANHANPAVRKQAALLSRRLTGTPFAFQAYFPDGTPAEAVKISYAVHEPLTEEERHAGLGLQQDLELITSVVCKGVTATDAIGIGIAGMLQDGKYTCEVELSGPLPRQYRKLYLKITPNTPVVPVEVLHGGEVVIRVVDEAGLPVEDAVVLLPWSGPGEDCSVTSGLLHQARRATGNHRTDREGRINLGIYPAKGIEVAAGKMGYEPVWDREINLIDGGRIEKTLTLTKAQPVATKLKFTTREGAVPNLRVLIVPESQREAVFGKESEIAADAANLKRFIEKGAIDAGSTDAKGEIKIDLVVDAYSITAFSSTGGDIFTSRIKPWRANPPQVFECSLTPLSPHP